LRFTEGLIAEPNELITILEALIGALVVLGIFILGVALKFKKTVKRLFVHNIHEVLFQRLRGDNVLRNHTVFCDY
jgi:hypothetical protein